MKTKVLLVLREVLIDIIIIVLVLATAFFLLKDYYPFNVKVAEAARYTAVNINNYKVIGDIENEQEPTKNFHEATSAQIDLSQTELRYVPGSVNPFVAEQGESDLPTDTIDRSSSSRVTTSESTNTESTSGESNNEG